MGCGFLYAVGKLRPTNYMIVSIGSSSTYYLSCKCAHYGLLCSSILVIVLAPYYPCHAVQLCQRPLNADLGKTNSNNDYIAPMFRDYLMPARHGTFLLPPDCCLGMHGGLGFAALPASLSQIDRQH